MYKHGQWQTMHPCWGAAPSATRRRIQRTAPPAPSTALFRFTQPASGQPPSRWPGGALPTAQALGGARAQRPHRLPAHNTMQPTLMTTQPKQPLHTSCPSPTVGPHEVPLCSHMVGDHPLRPVQLEAGPREGGAAVEAGQVADVHLPRLVLQAPDASSSSDGNGRQAAGGWVMQQ